MEQEQTTSQAGAASEAGETDETQVLTCPNCGRGWRAGSPQVARAKRFRCSGCNHVWAAPATQETPTAQETPPATTSQAATAPQPAPHKSTPKKQKTSTGIFMLLLSLILLGGIGLAAWWFVFSDSNL